MENVLEPLYYGELYSDGKYGKTIQQLREDQNKAFRAYLHFRSKLPDDMKDEFESLMDSHLDLLPLELEQNFDGFRIGARMMAEVFCNESLAEFKEAQKAAASKKSDAAAFLTNIPILSKQGIRLSAWRYLL